MSNDDADSWPRVRKKRFIAGAVCPACREEDRLVVEWIEASPGAPVERQRRCVACGFQEMAEEAIERPLSALPRIRLGAQAQEVAPSPVRLIDPKSLSEPEK